MTERSYTPLYVLNRQIKQVEKELEELLNDPSASHEEIAELEVLLSRHKMEFADRVAGLKVGG